MFENSDGIETEFEANLLRLAPKLYNPLYSQEDESQDIFGEAIAWVDIETTGLDPLESFMLEVAVVFTDMQGFIIGSHHSLISTSPGPDDYRYGPGVEDMHHRSGLLDEVMGVAVKRQYNEHSLDQDLEFMSNAIMKPGHKPYLGGVGPHFDRGFIEEYLPRFESTLHYRHIDMRTILTVFRQAGLDNGYHDALAGPKHRASVDIAKAILGYRRTLSYLRSTSPKLTEGWV